MRPIKKLLRWTSVSCLLGMTSLSHGAGITVVVENLAPADGTWLTPFWIALHDGTFDTHNLGDPASSELERLAEDGNTGPMSDALALSGAGSIQATVISDMGIPPLAPGETATITLTVDENSPQSRFFSYAAMVLPSNDAFVGNEDSSAHQLFDGDGNFLGAFITIYGTDVKDAGTEVNDELPENTAFFGQSMPDTGVDEHGVVHRHEGYLPMGSGGILDDPMFSGADFTTPGYEMARIFIFRTDTVVGAGEVSGTWTAAGSPYLVEGDITVPEGETLVIEPGVTVFFQSWYALTVNGHLEAVGTEDAPILFTATEPGSGEPGWKGIRFVNDWSGSQLTWCTMENGKVVGVEPFKRGGGVFSEDSNPTLSNCSIRNNRAVVAGGGVYAVDSMITISDSTISDNLVGYGTSGSGGGLYVADSTLHLTGSTIGNNDVNVFGAFVSAHGRGGGVFIRNTTGTLSRNVIAGNTVHAEGNVGSNADGGGAYLSGNDSNLLLANNTFSGNSATVYSFAQDGAGLYLYSTAPQIANTVVHGSDGSGIHFEFAQSTLVEYSDFFDNGDDDFTGMVPAGIGDLVMVNANNDPADVYFNILLDPRFEDAANGDYQLQADSPCIDAGNPDSPQDPDGTVSDIGAMSFDQDSASADINGDGEVDFVDLLIALSNWGQDPETNDGDVNGDGEIGFADLLLILGNWGPA